jgi:tRNA-Thr(GGU) m(6)t(6)A37 methyltransferase TsaA
MKEYRFQPIGIVHSCYKEKFGIPRQPGLAPAAEASLEILSPYNRPEAFRELEDYSHIWLTFVFHHLSRTEWSPTVRPPRLGGNQRVGVFSSRSPFRPNPIGLSVVALKSIELRGGGVWLQLGGIDLLDQTPVLDIKPYLPYADAIAEAAYGFAPAPQADAVELAYSEEANSVLQSLEPQRSIQLNQLLMEIMRNDPRPAYQREGGTDREYGMRLYEFNIRWCNERNRVLITSITVADDR